MPVAIRRWFGAMKLARSQAAENAEPKKTRQTTA
jgi:hypothetical protein